ncbi:MAG: nitronate monooxygenase [Clostridium sp.]|nr:nitronate monooxygenase [Clostridium sp.]
MTNRVCEILGIEKPVISAAMTWLTSAEFVAAVSEAGGAGVLGINAGQTAPTADPIETAERLRAQIRRVRELTDKPFGVNIFFGPEIDPFTAETLKVLAKEKPAFVLLLPFGPLNRDAVKLLKDNGIKIVARPISATIENLKQVLAEGADILIYTGVEAGGHASDYNVSLMSGFPAVRAAIDAPLMAAGGITEETAAKAAAAMGAEGIYAGTRFLVTEENPMAESVKQTLIETRAEDLIRVPDIPGVSYFVKNAVGLELEKMMREGADAAALNKHYMSRGGFLKGMLLGVKDEGIINCDQAVGSITSVKTCLEVVDELNIIGK